MTEFDPLLYWEQQRDSAETALIIAQQNLMRLMPEVFENVVFLEEYRQAEEPEGAA